MTQYDYRNNTRVPIQLLGMPNIMSSTCQFVSAPRISMLNHHLPQAMIINEPEFNKMFTGEEEKMIDYTFGRTVREHDCEIIKVIPKYTSPILSNPDCPQFYVIVLTLEDNGDRHLDYFTVDKYFMGTSGFGFITEIQNAGLLRPNEFLPKNVPISHSPAVKGNMYCVGTNLNVAYGSFPETIEDGFIISESAAKKLQTVQVSRRVIDCRMDRLPLNLNGNEDEDRFLPDIGSYVRDDGALCAFRPVHWSTCIADADKDALREPLPLQDDIVYIEPGSKIVDLTFNVNRPRLNNRYGQVRLYMENSVKCWEAIYNTYQSFMQKNKGKYKLTPKMSTLINTAIYRMVSQGVHVHSLGEDFRKKNYDIEGATGHPVDFIQVEVTYTAPRPVGPGSKITDLAGAKGVVGMIYADDWMPVDGYGIRADMMVDMNSPVGRNNPGQLYETGINRISEFVRRECKTTYEVKGPEAAFEKLVDWYNDVNPNYAKRVREFAETSETRKNIVKDAIDTYPKIWAPPFLDTLTPSEEEQWNALINIKRWATKWNVKSTPIKYKTLQADGSGKEFVTEGSFAIGSKYIIHLHKIPEITAPGPASVNNIGIPTKSSHESKNFPVSVNPYRYGEDELRVMAMDTDIKEVTRFQNLQSNSPSGVIKAISSILLSDNPTRIKRIPVSNGELMRTSAVLELFHGITATLGIETKTTKTEGIDLPEELTESIWNSDIIEAKISPIKVFSDDETSIRRSTTKRSRVQKIIDDIDTSEELEEGEILDPSDVGDSE